MNVARILALVVVVLAAAGSFFFFAKEMRDISLRSSGRSSSFATAVGSPPVPKMGSFPVPACKMSNSSGYPFFPGPPRKVFVDLGPFDGASVRLFLTNDLSDKGNWGTTAFALNGGKLRASSKTSPGAVFNQSEWEVVAVEANPNNSGHLEQQRATMLAQGTVKNYTLIAGTAIGVRNGNITLTLDNDNRGNEGSTTMNESLSAVGTRLVIPSLDIVTLFSDVIRPRRNDTIIVKMDIEGAEYQVVRRMIDTCLFDVIDMMGIEWHHGNRWVFGKHNATDDRPGRSNVTDYYWRAFFRLDKEIEQLGWKHKLSDWGRR